MKMPSIRVFIITAMLSVLTPIAMVAQNVMPRPSQMEKKDGILRIDSSFTISVHGQQKLEALAERTLVRLQKLTGIPLSTKASKNPRTTLEMVCDKYDEKPQLFNTDESYMLAVTSEGAQLKAATRQGILRGIETFLQLVGRDASGFYVTSMNVNDSPRFQWRGLHIDACRHWMPVDVIKRNLDGMALVKMNVLHWHLSEDQGFRVESKRFPKLHEMGSDGNYYTQDQVREIVAYAAERGIRVVPEFDMPGHTSAWFVGYPEIASAPGPYQIVRKWGVFDASMDPTREETYKFLDDFIREMSKLFPDEYFHIGGDEVTGKHWDQNSAIQEFKRKNSIADNHALQAYFNKRILAILKKHGKKMIGWDEIFHPDLPKDIVVHSWRGQKYLAKSAEQGYQGILSAGFYLDHIKTAAFHYAVDPIDSTIGALSAEAQSKILGGEACMWAEYVSPENVDSRIWPRAAAIAERLWSRATVRDVDEMYRRLEIVSKHLETVGLTHRTSYAQMLERIAGSNDYAPLKVLCDVVEPVKNYDRGRTRPHTQFTPLNRLVDAARPESDAAREFNRLVDEYLTGKISNARMNTLNETLSLWKGNHARMESLLSGNFLMGDIDSLSRDLSDVAVIAAKLVEVLDSRTVLTDGQRTLYTKVLERAEKQRAALLLMIVPSVKKMYSVALQ
jgi:hexosaminidase